MAKPNLRKVKGKTWDATIKSEDKELQYPAFTINSDALPEIKDWEVGDDYLLVVRATQDSKEERSKGVVEARFDIKAIAPLEVALGAKDMEKFDNEVRTGKRKLL